MPTFDFWWVLLLLPLAPWPALRRLERPRSRVVLAPQPDSQTFEQKPLSYWLWTGCAASLIVALAGPRPNSTSNSVPGLIQVVMDYSGSMEDELVPPGDASVSPGPVTRWDIATGGAAGVLQNLARLPTRRAWQAGLLVFARQPEWILPSGSAPETVELALSGLKPVKTPGETSTHIGWALKAALEPFLNPEIQSSGAKILLLITDGEHNSVPTGEAGDFSPRQAAQLAGELGVQIITLRVPASKSPESIRNQADQLLADLAQRTGGKVWDLPLGEVGTRDFLAGIGANLPGWGERFWSLPWGAILTVVGLGLAVAAWWREKLEG